MRFLPWLLVALVCVALSAAFGGVMGLAGMSIGLAAATVGVFALVGFTKLFAEAAAEGANPKQGAFFTALAFVVKIPLYILAFKAAELLGGAAPTCFIAGVVVVYSCLVTWGMTR
ncbi:MAG TPA: hypothetical protein VK934_10060 [Fimbriimonas sp.]|nr:hypothetical protein [Fimbriimonas sp.]